MTPPGSNSFSTSSRRPSNVTSTRRAPIGPRAASSASSSSSPSTTSTSSSLYPQAEYPFYSPSAIQVSRTVCVTVEVASSSAPASHMDVSQYHMPVTTSCYSPTTLYTYEDQEIASEYGASTSYSAQGSRSYTPEKSSRYYSQHPSDGIQEGSQYQYESSDDMPNRYKPTKKKSATGDKYESQTNPSQLIMLSRFLAVDSREDALVIEARAAIQEGRVADGNHFSPNVYGWESIIDNL